MTHEDKLKNILKKLNEAVLKEEDGYDDEDIKYAAENMPNYLDEHFAESLRLLCKRYEAKGLSMKQMHTILLETGMTVQQFYN